MRTVLFQEQYNGEKYPIWNTENELEDVVKEMGIENLPLCGGWISFEGEEEFITINGGFEGETEEKLLGMTYSDPEGIWEVVEVCNETVTVTQVQEQNINIGNVCEISLQEALWFLYNSN